MRAAILVESGKVTADAVEREVGAAIAQRAQPTGFRNGILFVTVDIATSDKLYWLHI